MLQLFFYMYALISLPKYHNPPVVPVFPQTREISHVLTVTVSSATNPVIPTFSTHIYRFYLFYTKRE